MLTSGKKILIFSNVKWIDNASTLTDIHDQTLLPPFSKR